MKVISFSLWGTRSTYNQGAIYNAKLTSDIYPGWISRFYCYEDVPEEVLNELRSYNSQVVMMDHYESRFHWRFLAASDENVEFMVSRDCDSRINAREKAAVDQWLDSGLPFHIMRDNKRHKAKIMAGMFGCECKYFRSINKLIDEWFEVPRKGTTDQIFLAKKIYPIIKKSHLVHGYNMYGSENYLQMPDIKLRYCNKDGFIGQKIKANFERY